MRLRQTSVAYELWTSSVSERCVAVAPMLIETRTQKGHTGYVEAEEARSGR
jgi:hypothetical protein